MTGTQILNLDGAPEDVIERIAWLDGVMDAARSELDAAYEEAYFEARIQDRFDAALHVGQMSKKRALALTRRRNRALGQSMRWGDGLDRTSTAYSP